MPELPEVETVRRGLAPLVSGRQIVDWGSHPSSRFASAEGANGRTIEGVDRRGKYLLLELDDASRLVIHLGMTGQLRVDPPGDDRDPYDRAWWHLDDRSTLALRDVRRFGRVAVVDAEGTGPAGLANLGPEPLGPDFTAEGLYRDLKRSTRAVKTQLLGQRVVAGVGNIYADEALWRAGISPASRRVSRPAAARLHVAVREVLSEGIANGGTTLRDYRNAEGGQGANQHNLDCYGRAGEGCHRCGTILRRRELDGRGTTWCPQCQRR